MPKKKVTAARLETSYSAVIAKAQGFASALVGQIDMLLQSANISLASPLESRVKSLQSIFEKIERKQRAIESVEQLDDLVGVRIMLLFSRDVHTVRQLIENSFEVRETEDASKRLAENQLGYSSVHYVLAFPETWLKVPTVAPYKDMRAEVQVRTMAQHIWAASEHVLQYKNEQSVPSDVRRAIYRVSALLETVDLEFERVLVQRDLYRESLGGRIAKSDELLNVDLLERILDDELPAQNKSPGQETYSLLLSQLEHFAIRTVGDLRNLLAEQRSGMLQKENVRLESARAQVARDEPPAGTSRDRIERGVYFVHTGLARMALQSKFGEPAYTESFLNLKQ